jgi:cytochrome c biogenesis factor
MWGATLWLAILAAAVLVFQPKVHEQSKFGSMVLHGLLLLPFIALASRFLVNDTSIHHVVAYGGAALPLKYRFAATWAAREGPLLLWVAWMTILAWVWRRPMGKETHATHALRLRLVHGFSLLVLLNAQTLNPFKAASPYFVGRGLNELLQTDLMVIHPPLIFLAYSFCLHAAAIALSSMFEDSTGIKDRMLSSVRPGLFVATLGIGLGGLWAYLILDWGGYWAWDPVETGSFLPWLALVFLSHMRTRPGHASDSVWIGGGMAAGGLALFATLVTRAGGVWASSVHTFVASDDGTAPTDAFSRMVLLKQDTFAGVEVMSYMILLLLMIGMWVQHQRARTSMTPSMKGVSLFLLPLIGAFIAVVGSLSDGLGLIPGADVYGSVPSLFFPLLLLLPLTVDVFTTKRAPVASDEGWNYHSLLPKKQSAEGSSGSNSMLVLAIVFLFFTGVTLLSENVFFGALALLFFTPLFYAPDATKAWPWATAGVMLALSGAWAELVTVLTAGVTMLLFVAPWLFAPEAETKSESFSIFNRKNQMQIALWASVVLVGLYLVLTLVLLLASIDAVNFDAHEVYGAPFVLAFAAAMVVYTGRKGDSNRNAWLVIGTLGVSLLCAVWQPAAFGMDADTVVSSFLVRGTLAWLMLPMLFMVILPVAHEALVVQRNRGTKQALWRRIPFGAHVVHLGLVLLLIGHVYTTVLVDRGDASHRITMMRDEVVIDGNFGYEFNGLVFQSEDLEVGDGYVGVEITVYELENGAVGEAIGTVEPGMIRFDSTATARSEVDTLTRWSGDIVFIFDGSQAAGLMSQSVEGGESSVQTVRVTVYDLPASHSVWLGWTTMLIGMAIVVAGDVEKNKGLRLDSKESDGEE